MSCGVTSWSMYATSNGGGESDNLLHRSSLCDASESITEGLIVEALLAHPFDNLVEVYRKSIVLHVVAYSTLRLAQ